MTRQNRVQPDGRILAEPARGGLMGNRGILHDAAGRLGEVRWRHRAWICCRLAFKDRRRQVMTTGRYTELFFHDEAVALAAGHRPCGECRRADFQRFAVAWEAAFGQRPSAPAMDAVLHAARAQPGGRHLRRWRAEAADLPFGTFVLNDDVPLLLTEDAALPFAPSGYRPAIARPTGGLTVLTPEPTVRVIAAGYRPAVRP